MQLKHEIENASIHHNIQTTFEENEENKTMTENQCKICKKTYKSEDVLQKHLASTHREIKYPGSECPFKASRKGILKNHLQFIHEGICEDCTICDTKHATKHNLKLHIETKHDKIKHTCSQCSYQGSSKYLLSSHIQHMHTNFKELYRCNQCENEYASKSIF